MRTEDCRNIRQQIWVEIRGQFDQDCSEDLPQTEKPMLLSCLRHTEQGFALGTLAAVQSVARPFLHSTMLSSSSLPPLRMLKPIYHSTLQTAVGMLSMMMTEALLLGDESGVV